MSRSARIVGAIALWLGGLLVGLYFTSNDSDPEPNADVAASATTEAVAVTTPAAAPATTAAAPSVTTTSTAPTTTAPPTTTTAAPVAAGPSVAASLIGGQFSLSGVVPDDATAQQLVAAATIVYGATFTPDLTIDAAVENAPWLAGAPRGIGLLPIIGEGSIEATNDGVNVTGKSPNDAALGAFASAVEASFGSPVDASGVEVTNLGFPSFNARRIGESIVLTGQLANQNVRRSIVEAVVEAYGVDAVTNNLILTDGLDVPYWSYTMPGVLRLFAAFPDYEINIENGITGGSLNAGANFAAASAELNETTIAIMPIALGIMSRDPSLGLEIAGHTDSVGSDEFNQILSEQRAQATADWLLDADIDPARIRVVGFGETQPIGDNSTAAGRALNRRVEFVFGPAQLILGQG